MVLGVAMLFIIPLVIIFYSSTALRTETLNFLQAKALAQHISDAAGEVWYEGKGARKTILVNYPSGMMGISLSGTSINCLKSPSGEIICDESIKYAGRDIVLTFRPDLGGEVQITSVSPAPLKNNHGITGNFEYSQIISAPISVDGEISPGLTVLVVKNEGPYVNVVRYSQDLDY